MTKSEINETLSALMDGELSEFETHRFFKQLEQLPQDEHAELMETWTRFHAASNVLGKNEQVFPGLDISGAVSAALADEISHSTSVRWTEVLTRPVASMAIAASVTLMVVFGYQAVNTSPEAMGAVPLAASTASPADQDIWVEEVLEVPEVATLDVAAEGYEQEDSQKKLIDERINHYMMRHAQNVSLQVNQNQK